MTPTEALISDLRARVATLKSENESLRLEVTLLRNGAGDRCGHCGRIYEPTHGRQKYCCFSCNQKAYRQRLKGNGNDGAARPL